MPSPHIASTRRRILHVEVGGTYGGSLRALELYLQFADHTRFAHDMLFYYPTPGAERIAPLVDNMALLHDFVPEWLTRAPDSIANVVGALKGSALNKTLQEPRRWIAGLRGMPFSSRIYKLLTFRHYDVVHVNNTFTYQPGILMACKMAKLPVVSHVRNPVPYGSFNRFLMRSLRMVVTVSDNYTTELQKWNLPVPVYTCHDGVVVPKADPLAVADIRGELLSAGGELLIGSVGRLDTQKGYDYLIRAARVVVHRNPGVRVAIAGDGPLRVQLQRQIDSLGLSQQVRLCGFREDVSNFISALDLFVSSSRWEGLPIAVVEAMLLGRPVVATDVGGVSEVARTGETGYLVPPNDPLGLADAILAALEKQESQPGAFIAEARHVAAMITDPERSAQDFEQRMNEVLGL